METDGCVRQLSTNVAKAATSFRIHAAYPPNPARFDVSEETWRAQKRHQVQTLMAPAGCASYSITDVLGCWGHHAKAGIIIERIYPDARPFPGPGFRVVAQILAEEWDQEEIWITRTEIELEVLS